MAQAAPQAGGAAGKQFSDQEMQKWLTDNSFTQEQIVKVLILGNSGSGKSFLCNALLGYNTFEHKYQASSCTADNTFAAAVMGDMAFVVCNIPGLIEADERNIPRNEAAIKAAFAYLPDAPTLAAFVLSNAGGRPADQDYMAIRSVMKYVNMETASTSMIANNVDWDEIDQTPEEYRADVIRQSQSIIGRPGMEMEFVSRMPRATRTNYEGPEMQHLCGQLVALFKRMQPAIMQPEEGAELVLDHKKLHTQFEALRAELKLDRQKHLIELEQEKAKWEATVKKYDEHHRKNLEKIQAELIDFKDRPPQDFATSYDHRLQGGCFSASSAFVMVDGASNNCWRAMSDLKAGDSVMGFDRRLQKLVPTRVLLVDRHPGELRHMRRIFFGSCHIEMTPDHLVFRQRVSAGDKTPELVVAGRIEADDLLSVHGAWTKVTTVKPVLCEPINVYTRNDTIVVNGAACSCHVISEWWGRLDIAPTKLLDYVSPGATGSPWFESLRVKWDSATEPILYLFTPKAARRDILYGERNGPSGETSFRSPTK